MPFAARFSALLPHLIAGFGAVLFIWQISRTPYLTSGLQFVAPLMVIMALHLGWLLMRRAPRASLSSAVLRRSLGTALLLTLATLTLGLVAPISAQAVGSAAGEIIGTILGTVFCVFIIGVILAILAAIGYGFFWVIGRILELIWPNDPPNTKLFDMASLVVLFAALGALSLEGLPQSYHFTKAGEAYAEQRITAPPGAIHAALQTATTPEVPLPSILATLPKPVRVIEQGGTRLGATREVLFTGREGSGALSIEVTDQSDAHAVFTVVRDTTPIHGWITVKSIRYDVIEQTDSAATLRVTMSFERQLAPAFAFTPLMRAAGYFAMDVLARDVKTRAEAAS